MRSITAQKRMPRRLPLYLPAELDGGHWRMIGRLRDLSVAGALIDADDLVPEDASVVLVCGHLRASGRTAWADGNRSGIEFDIPLTDEVVSSVRGDGLVVSAPRSFRINEEDNAA